jgi:hypothetical protein
MSTTCIVGNYERVDWFKNVNTAHVCHLPGVDYINIANVVLVGYLQEWCVVCVIMAEMAVVVETLFLSMLACISAHLLLRLCWSGSLGCFLKWMQMSESCTEVTRLQLVLKVRYFFYLLECNILIAGISICFWKSVTIHESSVICLIQAVSLPEKCISSDVTRGGFFIWIVWMVDYDRLHCDWWYVQYGFVVYLYQDYILEYVRLTPHLMLFLYQCKAGIKFEL